MEIEQATIVAHNYLQSKIAPLCDGDTLVIVRDAIQEDKDGWFFPYQAQGYLETKSLNHSVVGNWPIFVSRDGRIGVRRFGVPFKPDD